MRFRRGVHCSSRREPAGFSLLEVMVGMAALGALILSLYAAIAWGFAVMRMARENIRATQIMAEKMETIRLYNWDEINSNNFIPKTFSVPYYPLGGTSGVGLTYYGKMTVTNVFLGNSYDQDMRRVIVTLNWTNANLARTKSIETFVSRYGLQNYIY